MSDSLLYGLCFRSRTQKREAAREREAELEDRSREQNNLWAKLGDKCQAVRSYQEAGKAERLQQVSAALQKLSQQLTKEEVILKVRSLHLSTVSP